MAFQENLNASVYMFSLFRSHVSDVSHGRGAVQGSFRATLGVASVFVHVVLRPRLGPWICPTHHHHQHRFFFFGINLDYLDFSTGIFDL